MAGRDNKHIALLLVLLVGSLCMSCGDPLVDDSYRGQTLFSFEGVIHSIMDLTEDEVRVAIAWSPPDIEQPNPEDIFVQNSVSVSVSFPARFKLNIFHPPKSEYLRHNAEGYGIGYIVVYEDRNQNLKFETEELIGGAPDQVLIYAPEELPANQSPTGQMLPPGFYLVPLPLSCWTQSTSPEGSCHVNLGSACQSAADCGFEGVCLHDVMGIFEFPGGYCAMDYDTGGCSDAQPIEFEGESEDGRWQSRTYWVKSCRTSSDCRVNEGYSCDLGVGACLPTIPAWLLIDEDWVPPNICTAD